MKAPNYKPLLNRVLVLADGGEKKTEAGLIIPDSAVEQPFRGVVVAVGDGKPEEPMVLKPGTRISYSQHAGTEINLEGIEYLLMRQNDVEGYFPAEESDESEG